MSITLLRLFRVAALGAGLAIAAAAARPAAAQNNASAAQALYDQATADMDAKKFDVACPKLEEVIRLVPEGVGAKLTLAQCYEGAGKLASAWSQYALAESAARAAKQAERAKKSTVKIAQLKPKLAMLTIEVSRAAREVPSLTIERDGSPIGEVQWGAAVPVDRGEHKITARAPGYLSWTGTVVISKDGVREKISVPLLEKEPPPPPPTATASASATALIPTAAPPKRPWQAPLGIAVLSVGVAGLAAGGVFGGLALWKKEESITAGCSEAHVCPPDAARIREEARLYGTVSTISLAAGGGLTALGGLLWILSPRSSGTEKSPGAPEVGVMVSPENVGVRVRGAF